jgi:hypothetical protein
MKYKIVLSDKHSKQGLQLYDVVFDGKIVGSYSAKPLKKYVDIYDVDKNGYCFINNKTFKTIQREVTK